MLTSSCMSIRLVWCSCACAPMPDARVVDQRVEAAEALLVGGDHRQDRLLVVHVGRHGLHVVALALELGASGLELVGLAGGDGQAVALLAEDVGDGEADPSGGSGDDGSAVGHGAETYAETRCARRSPSSPSCSPRSCRSAFATDDEEPAPHSATPVTTIAKRVERLRAPALRPSAGAGRRQPAPGGQGRARRSRPRLPGRRAPRRRGASTSGSACCRPAPTCAPSPASIFERAAWPATTTRAASGCKIVEGTATANRVLDEITIAHELDHALEDQAIGLDEDAAAASDDRGYAYKALVEGAATQVMYEYLGRYFRSDVALGGLLGSAFAGTGTEGLPQFVTNGLVFPYLAGQRFVAELLRRGRRRLDPGRPRRAHAAAHHHGADPASAEVDRRPSPRSRSGCRRPGGAGAASPPARSANGRRASCWARRARRRAGAATATRSTGAPARTGW